MDISGTKLDVSGSNVDISGSVPAVVEKKSVRARRMIQEVEAALKIGNAASVSAQFSEHQLEFPTLFAILLRRDYPRDVLASLLSQLEKVESGQTSQHDASVAVGGVLVDRFVKPQLGLSSQQ